MSMPLNEPAYKQLLAEDIEWLLTCPRTLERDHIEQLLRWEHEHAIERLRSIPPMDPKDQP